MLRGRWIAGLTLLLVACQEPTRSLAPDARSDAPVLTKKPAPDGPTMLAAPLFGLDAAPDGSLLAAVASAGVFRIRHGETSLIASLPGASDVEAVGVGNGFVITGGSDDPSQLLPTSRKLFWMSHGKVREVADLWAYEQAANPDKVWHTGPTAIESNPFGIALSRGRVLVADAAANDILVVDRRGVVDWVAVLTPVVPGGPEPVPTSVVVGPDGAYYVGELTGFPGTPGLSRIWRIAAGSRHVLCPSAKCTLVAGGFTSIMELAFDRDGTLYVVEMDEAGWFAVEANGFAPTPAGGTVNACNVRTGRCAVVASRLSLPTAIAVDHKGKVWVAEHVPMLFAAARVRAL